MADAKHTPGDWHYRESPRDPDVWEITAAFAESPIAEVPRWKDFDGADSDEAKANLALMAAAPKLLDALRKCVFAVESVAHLQGNAEAMAYAEYGKAALAAAMPDAAAHAAPGPPPPSRYISPPESIGLARETMRGIRDALTRDADGRFPASYAAMDWEGLNMQPPDTAWQDMDMGQRYDLLRYVLDESIWSLEPSPKWDEPGDSQKLAIEFVEDEARGMGGAGPADAAATERASSPADLAEGKGSAGPQHRGHTHGRTSGLKR